MFRRRLPFASSKRAGRFSSSSSGLLFLFVLPAFVRSTREQTSSSSGPSEGAVLHLDAVDEIIGGYDGETVYGNVDVGHKPAVSHSRITIMSDADSAAERRSRIVNGDPDAIAAEFERHRAKLRRLVQLRLDRRLSGRVDPSDVLQETYIEVAKRASQQINHPEMSFSLWLRLMTSQKLLEFHRRHLGTQLRDVSREVPFPLQGLGVSSEVLASEILSGRSPVSEAADRTELLGVVENVLNEMEPIDREVLSLRHFEDLSNAEVAILLGLSKTAASNRYIRALARLKRRLSEFPDILGQD